MIFNALLGKVIKSGSLTVVAPDGKPRQFGDGLAGLQLGPRQLQEMPGQRPRLGQAGGRGGGSAPARPLVQPRQHRGDLRQFARDGGILRLVVRRP